ncbi:MAG: hypothetical protein Q8M07_12455 [Prosthecobacter sp.]|nr:hypothetical protein [Prosthecobacter sp.]
MESPHLVGMLRCDIDLLAGIVLEIKELNLRGFNAGGEARMGISAAPEMTKR